MTVEESRIEEVLKVDIQANPSFLQELLVHVVKSLLAGQHEVREGGVEG